MPALWRLYRSAHGPGLDGAGGIFADGRWHSRGERVVYFGASPAIVVLERLSYTDPDLLPGDLRLAHFEFSKTVAETKVEELAVLPVSWIQDAPTTRRLGDSWRMERPSCLLLVPSAILPEASNYVFNPQHADARFLRMIRERPFRFDPRLL
jgi:RES domain-containing protein